MGQHSKFPKLSRWVDTKNKVKIISFFPLIIVLGGCANVPLKEGGTLTSYSNLSQPKGKFAKKKLYLNAGLLKKVRTVSIFPTSFTSSAEKRVDKLHDRILLANSIDRAICYTLSEKYKVVPFSEPADLTVRTVITDVVPTQPSIAGAAKVISIGSAFALPVGIPRLPFGLGGLAVEAEATDQKGAQVAAIVWSKGANSFTSEARVSQVGDAYDLAAAFGAEFSKLVIEGKEPGNFDLRLPSGYEIRTKLGGKPGSALCENFGRNPGVLGAIGASFGAPPSWTDKGAKSASVPKQTGAAVQSTP
ncbi:MAG TPA: DUF3313 domain-containing protein [Pseudochrobactrum sp.]|nr:DUF3313 domain-containing protein [Pseudochrobactrum sp.]